MTMNFAANESISSKNRASFLMLLLFLTGILLGMLFVRHFDILGTVFSGVQNSDDLAAFMNRGFAQTFLSNGKFLLLIYLLSFQRWGAMMVPPVFGMEGLFFGGTVCSLISFMGSRGAIMAVLLMLFRLIMILPYSFILGGWSVEQSLRFPLSVDHVGKIGVLAVTLAVMLLASFLECTLGRWLGGMYYLTFGV